MKVCFEDEKSKAKELEIKLNSFNVLTKEHSRQMMGIDLKRLVRFIIQGGVFSQTAVLRRLPLETNLT